MAERALYIDDVLLAVARGAARADMAAHAEAAQCFAELAREVGVKTAGLYAHDWRLEERKVTMQVRVEVARSDVDGLLRILVKGKTSETEGQMLQVEDRYVASGAAPLNLDGALPQPGGEPTSEPPAQFSEAQKNEVQGLLFRVANADEMGRAREKALQVGDPFSYDWRMLQHLVLRRLKWPTSPLPKWPEEKVRDFLKSHAT